MAVSKGKPKDEKREDKRKRKAINRTAKENAQFVLGILGVVCFIIVALVIYWATRPLPSRED